MPKYEVRLILTFPTKKKAYDYLHRVLEQRSSIDYLTNYLIGAINDLKPKVAKKTKRK